MGKIRRRQIAWKDREHLFTPKNIVKYELATPPPIYKAPVKPRRKFRSFRPGPIIWLMRDGQSMLAEV